MIPPGPVGEKLLPPIPEGDLRPKPLDVAFGPGTAEFRAQFGFVSGKEVAFFPSTDAEHAAFKRWLDITDDRRLNQFLIDNQDWFAEKVNSFDVSRPAARILIKKGAPPKLIDEFKRLVPPGLAAPVESVRWSGNELESIRTLVAEEVTALNGERATDPALQAASKSVLERSRLVRDLADRGVEVVWVRRVDEQVVQLVVDVEKSSLGQAAVGDQGRAALDAALGKTTIPAEHHAAVRLEPGLAPKPMRAQRENDPGQLKAGVALVVCL